MSKMIKNETEVIVACEMLEYEIKQAMLNTKNNSRVIWLERGLHEMPKKLHDELQTTLESVYADQVLFAFGLCGNALDGISSPRSSIVIPRFHDCIHMLLATEEQPRPSTCGNCLYYTDGWFKSDMAMLQQYERFKKKRGEEKAKRIFQKMFENYRGIYLIDTGLPWRSLALEEAERTSELFELELCSTQGSLTILERLLKHDWDENFIICNPGEAISYRSFLEDQSSRATTATAL